MSGVICWNCLVYCFQNFLFKIYPDLVSSKLNFGVTRRVPLVEQERPTLPEHLSSPPVFTGVRVTQSLVLYVCCVDRCLSFCPFSIVLSVLLRYTDSDCPFGIFKLFFHTGIYLLCVI